MNRARLRLACHAVRCEKDDLLEKVGLGWQTLVHFAEPVHDSSFQDLVPDVTTLSCYVAQNNQALGDPVNVFIVKACDHESSEAPAFNDPRLYVRVVARDELEDSQNFTTRLVELPFTPRLMTLVDPAQLSDDVAVKNNRDQMDTLVLILSLEDHSQLDYCFKCFNRAFQKLKLERSEHNP